MNASGENFLKNSPGNSKPVPKTGDGANPALWVFLALVGQTGLVMLVAAKRKRREPAKERGPSPPADCFFLHAVLK